MIIGAHVMLQSRNPSADRTFFGGVLNLPAVDAGGGFMIFGVPPAEVAIHDSDRNDIHQLYLMCADASRFIREMERLGIACTTPVEQRWGKAFEITLPGGGRLGVYEPRHARPAGKATTMSGTKRNAGHPRNANPRRRAKQRRRRRRSDVERRRSESGSPFDKLRVRRFSFPHLSARILSLSMPSS